MHNGDNIYQTALVSLAGAVVQAMLSEDAETAFIEEARNLLDQLGDTLTLPVASIISLEQLYRRERRELLDSTLQGLGLDLQQLDWEANPELALEFQSRIWAHLFQRFLNTHQVLSSHVELLPVTDAGVADDISESYARIIDISHSRRGRHTRALHFNLVEHILLLCDELAPRQERTQLDRRVVAARDFLLAHYREKTTVEQVAAAANTAPSTLTALFKNQMGDNLMRWRDQLRMQRARELLQESDKPIKTIANEVGYDDPMFFSRRFKQLTGWSPTQIRDNKTP